MSNLHNLATRTTDCLALTSSSVAITTGVTMHCVKGTLVRASLTGGHTTAFTEDVFVITNNRVGPDSLVLVNLASFTAAGGMYITRVFVNSAGGSFSVGVAPLTSGGGNSITALTLDFYVLNPVCSR